MNRFLITIVCFVAFAVSVIAQDDFSQLKEEQIYREGNKYNTWSVSLGFGPVVYYADIIDYTAFPDAHLKWAPTIMLSKQFKRPWGIDLQWMRADMYGEKNNRYFEGDLYDVTLNGKLNVNQLAIFGPINDKWNIYAKLGIGLTYFRSRVRRLTNGSYTNPDGSLEVLNPGDFMKVKHVYENIEGYPTPHGWSSEDYLVLGYDRAVPDKKTDRHNEVVVPVGAGVKYRINKNLDLGVEVMMRMLNDDNLDVNLSGADNDSYMHASVNITYKIGKKNKRHSSWTYKDFNMNYRRQRGDDPMAHKLDSLKQVINDLAVKDSLIVDTTTVYSEEIIYKEGISESVFFAFDKFDLTDQSNMTLARVAQAMLRDKNLRIRVVGYCDSRGSLEYNLKLSERRCKAVLDVLIDEYGIAADRFQTDYKGETELLSDTEQLKPRGLHLVNRRVDLFVIVE